MKRKEYESPRTLIAEVELENGFMAVSVYEKEENTEDLTINSQEKELILTFRVMMKNLVGNKK